jgi:hypothetical protein
LGKELLRVGISWGGSDATNKLEGFRDCGPLPIWVLSCRPQWSQKKAAPGNIVLQNGQFGKSQNPQRLQNLASIRFSEWQLEQRCIFMNLRAANISDFPLSESICICYETKVKLFIPFAHFGSDANGLVLVAWV